MLPQNIIIPWIISTNELAVSFCKTSKTYLTKFQDGFFTIKTIVNITAFGRKLTFFLAPSRFPLLRISSWKEMRSMQRQVEVVSSLSRL